MELDHADLYKLRMLLFLEVEPQSNQYAQVILSPEEYKRVSAAFGTIVDKDGAQEQVKTMCSEETYTLPDLEDIDYAIET